MKKFISILLVLALAVSLFAGSALAVAGDSSGTFADFPCFSLTSSQQSSSVLSTPSLSSAGTWPLRSYGFSVPSSRSSSCLFCFVLPSSLSAGTFTYSSGLASSSSGSIYSPFVYFYDSTGTLLSYSVLTNSSIFIPSSSYFIAFVFTLINTSDNPSYVSFQNQNLSYSNFAYSSSGSGSGYDPSLDEDILAGVESIAQSLLDLETGPYSGVTNITPNYDDNGNFTNNTLTVQNDSTLNGLLNALGISSTSSALYLKNLYDNWGNSFQYILMDTPVSGGNVQAEIVPSAKLDLPTFISRFGYDLSLAVQQMRRDQYEMNRASTWRDEEILNAVSSLETSLSTDINNALYAETDTTPSETWSVAQWLKGLYNSITGFFSSFWSPAETAIKEANEEAMQATVTNDVHTTVQNVNDFASMQSAVTGFLPTGDISGFNSLNDTAFYIFWSEETHKAMLPPEKVSESVSSNSRLLLSASPPSSFAPVVDYGAFERNQALYQSLLGGG